MKIKEVEYSRLFNLADYQNERIGFKAEITDSDCGPNAVNAAIGQLFFKVLEIEEIFQAYRNLLREIDNLRASIRNKERHLQWLLDDLAELELRLKELEERDDIRACQVVDTKELIEERKKQIEDTKAEIAELQRQLRERENEKVRMRGLIKAGKFDFEGRGFKP